MKAKEFTIDLTMKTEEIKKLLWELTYNPAETLSKLSVEAEEGEEEEIAKEIKAAILQKIREEKKTFLFAQKDPVVSTEGVDMEITDPVVRDIIIEKCYSAVAENSENLEKAIGLLATQSYHWNYERRLFGGLRSIGFNAMEADYIKRTCELYPVHSLLKQLKEKGALSGTGTKKVKAEKEPNQVEPKEKEKVTTSLDAVNLIQKKEEIEKILTVLDKGAITSSSELEERKKTLLQQREFLEQQIAELTSLEETIKAVGSECDFIGYLISNKETIRELYKLSETL